MFEDDIMETSMMELETSLMNSDEEILEATYIEVDASSRIDFGRNIFNNLVTPKKQNTIIRKLDSPMIIDVNSPQIKKKLAVSDRENIYKPTYTNSHCDDTKKGVEVIEISDDSELSDAETPNKPDNNSYDDDMEVQSPFRQNIANNASSYYSNSSRFPLKEINTNKQDNVVKSLKRFIFERNHAANKDTIEYDSDCMEVQSPFKSVTNPSETNKSKSGKSLNSDKSLLRTYESILDKSRNNVPNKDTIEYDSDCMEVQSPFKFVTNPSETNKSKSGKSSNADKSLLRAYESILNKRYSVEKLTPKEKGYDESMLSFISSLSDKTYGLPCHPGAVFFKRHFRKAKANLARHLYYIYNEHIFDNQLPKDMPIKWSKKLTSSCGITTTKVDINPDTKTERHFAYITLSKKILTTAERLRDTLLHEMCHAAVWLINKSTDSHGPVWKLWAVKATFCLPELPPIKRCHNYETNYKYLYKCRDCGYVIGRSRPSDKLLNRCVCGYCGGRFRVETAKLENASFSG